MVALFLEENKTNDDGDGKENGKKKKKNTAVLHGSSSTWFQTSRRAVPCQTPFIKYEIH